MRRKGKLYAQLVREHLFQAEWNDKDGTFHPANEDKLLQHAPSSKDLRYLTKGKRIQHEEWRNVLDENKTRVALTTLLERGARIDKRDPMTIDISKMQSGLRTMVRADYLRRRGYIFQTS